jgi:predicted metal-dependent HD superfamily phosphohydrolase
VQRRARPPGGCHTAGVEVADTELRLAWERAVGRGPLPEELLDQVVGRYREPHRRYHTTTHLVRVLRHVGALAATDEVTAEAPDLGAVVVAAFFHDAVYDPPAGDNEARSAALAARRLAELADDELERTGATRWPAARRAQVARLVHATAHLEPPEPTEPTGDETERAVLLDADLAVLGSEPAEYQAYVNGVRAEYAHLTEEAWRAGRAEVLRHLLAQRRLFRTVAGRGWWERRARANLTAELATLG